MINIRNKGNGPEIVKGTVIKEETLTKLEEVGASLDYSNMISYERPESNLIELKAGPGQAFMFGLFKSPEVAVARTFASAGSKWPNHFHREWEIFIVYKGQVEVSVGVEPNAVVLKERQCYYVPEMVKHSAYFPVDTWLIAITIPGTEAFPHAE